MALVSNAHAHNWGTAGCGLGAVVFKDKPGKIQIVAATINDIISPQTFAITSGTSNCVEESSEAAAETFINVNQVALEKDISRGQGEALAHLSSLYGCSDVASFSSALQGNFGQIFPRANTPPSDVSKAIHTTIENNKQLAQSCQSFG